LQEGGQIVCGNATRLGWEEVCPKKDGVEIYILGNPPYLGTKYQLKEHKDDMAKVFKGIKNYKTLDYVSCWFMIGSRYVVNSKAQFSFVSTNSISQGAQVAALWLNIFEMRLEISFAHQSFKWTNNAKGNAGVICIIVGVRNPSSQPKYLYSADVRRVVNNINPFLTTGRNIIVQKRTSPLSEIPIMSRGSCAVDGGNLILSTSEKNQLIDKFPRAIFFIKKIIGGQEFIRGSERWCLWIEDKYLSNALAIPVLAEKIDKVREFRLRSTKKGTQKIASTPHKFAEIKYIKTTSIIIPVVSSIRRKYIPTGFIDEDTIISVKAFAIYGAESFILAIISSLMHMVWVRAVGGRMKTDYSYINTICYNAFPFPGINDTQKTSLEDHVFKVLDEREQHPEKTMAQLYDPDKMPAGLRQAHHAMDLAVEQCYQKKPFNSDEERLEYLFKLYEEMIENEER
jgi:hypothetical protein